MRSVYFKELHRYSEQELKKSLAITEDHVFMKTIGILKEKKILVQKAVALYAFEFVGVLILREIVLFCLPKYISKSDEKSSIKQLLVLFKEYSKRERLDKDELESIGSIESIADYNILSVIIYILNDYLDNGLYSNEKNTFIFNGDDEINWFKTIEEIQPILNEGEPLYLEYYTNSIENDEENYFRQLHMYVISECTKILNDTGLSEYLDLEPITFDINEDRFGAPQSIISRVSNELNIQFVSRKQMVLKAIYSFISKEKMESDNFAISFYGTRKFEFIWEKTCAYILDNKYDIVKKYIANPIWRTNTGKIYQAETLIPDIITIHQHLSKRYFIVSDAKYYSIKLSDTKFENNPGIGDVTKQYLYQLAYNKFINEQRFDVIHNALLFPSEDEEIVRIGTVTLEFLKNLNLEDILLVKLPAHKVFEMYINSKKLDIEYFINFLI